MRIIVGYILALGVALMISSVASAHVMITDETKTKGAILHIMPDDDPIAGEAATLYFDSQDGLLNAGSKIDLKITKEGSDESVRVPTTMDGSLISSKYIFPSQAQYTIRYSIDTDGKKSLFSDTVRIARGSTETSIGKSSYSWANGMMIASISFAAVLAIIAWNNRKDIREQSKF